jgi:hypothetical protein
MPKYLEYFIIAKDFAVQISDSAYELALSVYNKLQAEDTDLQTKLFYLLLTWLVVSLLLILITWKTLGHYVVKMVTPNGEYSYKVFCCLNYVCWLVKVLVAGICKLKSLNLAK